MMPRVASSPWRLYCGIEMVAEDRVLVGREVAHEAHAQPVLGHVAEARGAAEAGVAERPALDPDRAAGRRPDAGQRLEQLRLAVAGDARDADDLAGAHREAHALDAA